MADQFRPFEAFRSTCNFSSNIWSSRGCSEFTNTKFYSVDLDCRWVASKLSSWTWRSQNIQVCAVTALGLILSDKSRLQNGLVRFLLGPWNACLFILCLFSISNGPIATRCSVFTVSFQFHPHIFTVVVAFCTLPLGILVEAACHHYRCAGPLPWGREVAALLCLSGPFSMGFPRWIFQFFGVQHFFWLSNWVSLLQGWCYRKKPCSFIALLLLL